MQVENILQSKGRAVTTVTAGSTIAEAVALLNGKKIGAVVVVDGKRVVGILSEIFKQNTCEHWIALLEKHDIPTCKVMALHEILGHPQIEANALIHSHEDAERGKIVTLGPPVSMSATPTIHERVAPMLGEHTEEVLREYGLDDGEIAALRAGNVIN